MPINIEIIKGLPKVEQHIHIVGSIKPETFLWLIEKSGCDLPYNSVCGLEKFYIYRDFPHFIEIYSTVNDTIIDEKYYERITYEMLENCASSNVKHVEAIFSPYDHIRRGLEYGKMLDTINRGIKKAADDFKITCNIRVDLVRNYGPEIGMKVLDLIEEKRDNIVAIDTGGTEFGYPPRPYEFCYERAREMGLHTVAHQGEAAGVDYMWECLNTLKPERIGHGVAASEDVALMREIAFRDISIETCPISNVRTGAVPNLREHPIKDFIANGIKVSVNTDDPPMFGTSMNYEYLQLHDKLGFTVEDLFQISLDSIDTSFLPKENKIKLKKDFKKQYNSLTSEFEWKDY